jgi:PIN domain nuclease of toxin-antitoxin system
MILLDTHVWLWLLHDPDRLSTQAQAIINVEEPKNGLLVSSISVLEIAVKSSIGKLSLPNANEVLVLWQLLTTGFS